MSKAKPTLYESALKATQIAYARWEKSRDPADYERYNLEFAELKAICAEAGYVPEKVK